MNCCARTDGAALWAERCRPFLPLSLDEVLPHKSQVWQSTTKYVMTLNNTVTDVEMSGWMQLVWFPVSLILRYYSKKHGSCYFFYLFGDFLRFYILFYSSSMSVYCHQTIISTESSRSTGSRSSNMSLVKRRGPAPTPGGPHRYASAFQTWLLVVIHDVFCPVNKPL